MSARMLSIRELSMGVFDGPHATPELHDEGAAVFLGIPNIRPDGSLDLAAARWVAEAPRPSTCTALAQVEVSLEALHSTRSSGRGGAPGGGGGGGALPALLPSGLGCTLTRK